MIERHGFAIISLISFMALVAVTRASHFPMGVYYVEGQNAYPIVTAKGEDPIAIIDGQEKKVPITEITFSKVPLYAEGFIDVSKAEEYRNSLAQRSTFSLESGADIPTQGFVDIEFTPTADYRDLYALVVSGSEQALALKDPEGLYMSFSHIGNVTKGRLYTEGLKAYFPYDPDEIRKIDYAVLFFDQGSPVLSTLEPRAYEHFRLRRREAHEERLATYLESNRRATAKQLAYSTFMPYLPKELYNEVGGVKTKVILNVSSKGWVKVESFSDLDNPKAKEFISKAMTDWFFYPKLEGGRAVPVRTATMIEF